MKKFPYVIISTAMSLDGYIDDTSKERLVISNKKDLERVKLLRESCDGILVGANTIRKDNPKLLPKSDKKLTKITLTSSGVIDTASNFFRTGNSDKIIYTVSSKKNELSKKLSSLAIVESAGEKIINLETVLSDLYNRGMKRLLVEGGTTILTQFLQEGLVDELQIAVAGFFVGEKNAPRFVNNGEFEWNKNHKLHLKNVAALDDIAVLIYKT